MRKLKYGIIGLIILVFLAVPVFAQEISTFSSYYFSPRVFSMGGAYTAYAWGPDGIFYNPAAYSLPGNRDFFLIDPTVRINFSGIELFQTFMENGSNIEQILADPTLMNKIMDMDVAIGASGLPLLGWVGGGFALAVYDSLDATFNFKPGLLTPDVYVRIGAEVGAIAGLSFAFGPLHIGANVKLLYRAWAEETTGLLNLLNFDADSGQLPFPVYYGQGLGFDVGAILRLGNLQLGLVVKDIYTRINYWQANTMDEIGDPSSESTGIAYVPMQVNVGVAYKMGTLIPVILYNIVLTADIQDINGFIEDLSAENYYTLGSKVFMGVEAQTLGLFKIRAGLMQGYPTFGLTINLVILQINLAYYTRELSSIPGFMPEQNILINFSFIW